MQERYQQDPSNPKMRPGSYLYNLVLNAWVKCGNPEAAEKLLRQIPLDVVTTVSYTEVISAWARRPSPQDAQRLLEEMLHLYKQEGNVAVKPNSYTYTTVISAWSRSVKSARSCRERRNAANMALQLLHQSQQSYTEGDVSAKPTSSVISSLAKVGNAEKAEELLGELWNLYQ